MRDHGPAYRAVASDLDGTLLRSDGSLSDRTIAAVERVGALGIEVVLVTSRPPRWVGDIARALRCHPLVICSNGGLIYDTAAGRVVSEHPIPQSAALEIVVRLRALLADVAIAVESSLGTGFEPHYHGTWTVPGDALVADAVRLLELPACKLCVRHGERGEHWEIVERVREAVGDLGDVTSSGPDAPIEVAARGVTKALALEILAERVHVGSHEVIAFGDMPNDLPMLRWAGRSIAPANAHSDVLTVVDEVTADCDHDGVAMVLEDLVRPATREQR